MENQDQQTQTSQFPNQMPLVNNSSGGSKIIPIGLGILFVLVAIGSYLLGTKNGQIVVQSQQGSVVPTTIPSPTPVDETANWKTYTSKEYTFKYPSDWEEDKNIESGGPMFRPINKSSICSIQVIGPTKVGSSVPLEDTYKIAGGTLLSRDEITIDEHKAIKQVYYINSSNTLHRDVIVKDPLSLPSTSVAGDISTQILLEVLSNITTNDKNDQRCNQVFDQILSTFQFSN